MSNRYVVTVDDCYVRDMQIYWADRVRSLDVPAEKFWKDANGAVFVGVFEADDAEGARQQASRKYGYPKVILDSCPCDGPEKHQKKDRDLEISKTLIVSSVHLHPSTVTKLLDKESELYRNLVIWEQSEAAVTVQTVGYRLGFVTDEDIPEDLKKAFMLAIEHDCDAVSFDADGNEVDSLHDYRSDWDNPDCYLM